MIFIKAIKYVIKTFYAVLELYVSIHHYELVEWEGEVVEGCKVEQVLVILGCWPETPVLILY